MSNMCYFEVPYTCKCEKCGKEMSGTIRRGPLQVGGKVLSTGLQAGVNSAEMKFSKKLIESDIENGTAKSFTASLHTCTSCGARQSWVPMAKPKKPSYISLYIAGLIVFPLISLLIWAIGFFDKIVPFIILMAIGVFLGIFLPYYYQKKYKSKEMERYKELLFEYDKYKEDMKDRTTHNKPEINWSLARQIPIK